MHIITQALLMQVYTNTYNISHSGAGKDKDTSQSHNCAGIYKHISPKVYHITPAMLIKVYTTTYHTSHNGAGIYIHTYITQAIAVQVYTTTYQSRHSGAGIYKHISNKL